MIFSLQVKISYDKERRKGKGKKGKRKKGKKKKEKKERRKKKETRKERESKVGIANVSISFLIITPLHYIVSCLHFVTYLVYVQHYLCMCAFLP